MFTSRAEKQTLQFEAIAASLGWSPQETTHARDTYQPYSDGYADECVVLVHSGRELRTPAYPSEVSYVRITQLGFELNYWNLDEIKESPSEVLGALMGALKNHIEPPNPIGQPVVNEEP